MGRWLGEDELHSRAVLTAASQNGQPVGYHAEVSVKSDSGEYNREQFGAIFLGAQKGKSTAKPSGDWTLSADIEAKVIKDLEQNSAAFRHARTDEERMRILSGLFKEGGARAAGGLVRAGGKSQVAWSLELKGDENFPGPAGRQRLKDQQRALLAALVGSPDTADAIVVEARDATTKLEQRRRAVADPEKYTDLPEELRQQQVALIDDHLRDFRKVAEQALRVALRVDRGEAGSATTDPGRRRPGSTVSSDVSPDRKSVG